MKKKLYLLLIVIVSLVLVACGNKNMSEVPSNENPKTNKENINVIVDEDVEEMKTFNVVAGSQKMVKILELLGYENVVGIPCLVFADTTPEPKKGTIPAIPIEELATLPIEKTYSYEEMLEIMKQNNEDLRNIEEFKNSHKENLKQINMRTKRSENNGGI